jgi:hypothetical protein
MTDKRSHPCIEYLLTLTEAVSLINISDDLKKHKVVNLNKKKAALYKATIIHLCAAWERFLEAVVEDSLDCLVKNANKSSQIPTNLLLRISKHLNSCQDEREIWKISDSGWKNELRSNYNTLKSKFNTPRPQNVDEFIYQTIGLKNLSNSWRWVGQNKEKSIQKLNEFMDLRGDLTHKLRTSKNVHQIVIEIYINFFYRISIISSNIIRKHIYSLINIYPWDYQKPRTLLKN